MGKVFWGYFHSIMVLVLLAIWVITEIVESGKEIGDTLKNSESKSKHSTGETIYVLSYFVYYHPCGYLADSQCASEQSDSCYLVCWNIWSCLCIYSSQTDNKNDICSRK